MQNQVRRLKRNLQRKKDGWEDWLDLRSKRGSPFHILVFSLICNVAWAFLTMSH